MTTADDEAEVEALIGLREREDDEEYLVGEPVAFLMAAGVDAPKTRPAEVALQTLDAIEAGRIEVLTDAISKRTKANLSRDHELIYPAVQADWDALTSIASDGSK